MTFALFVETSLRGIDTLMRAYREILSPAGIGLATVLRDASEIRQALLAPPLMLNGPAGALGKYCRCDIFSPPDYQHGAWRAIVTLDALKTRNVRNAATRQFELPVLERRLITPDGPYGLAVPDGEGWKMGFCFREGRAELHLYSNGIAEGENPVTLQEVAETLCAGVDSIFSGHDGDAHP
ncbi:hypothetical protein O3W44_20650 [Pantoea sp. LMR881]|nr:hypothetical protein [Pantoea sp. LMR881]MCZ4060968.1 hypothetical protein [Pantoea sp. LMR881]